MQLIKALSRNAWGYIFYTRKGEKDMYSTETKAEELYYLKSIANDNRKRLLLEIVKEQYEIGDITKTEYSNTLKRLRDDISKRG